MRSCPASCSANCHCFLYKVNRCKDSRSFLICLISLGNIEFTETKFGLSHHQWPCLELQIVIRWYTVPWISRPTEISDAFALEKAAGTLIFMPLAVSFSVCSPVHTLFMDSLSKHFVEGTRTRCILGAPSTPVNATDTPVDADPVSLYACSERWQLAPRMLCGGTGLLLGEAFNLRILEN